ncbi:MarR family transcriptional regulator [Sphingomonas sp. PB2P19]|uniref:MarR family winged helix-turn-helix transcriptional regulator n=1 Tax=Sphingomonas rhamnosi TaxID=3096156 RepID=UPI002FC9D417
MTEIITPPRAQYLREDGIRGGMDLLMFAHRSHLTHADDSLAKKGLGRAHHRILYFVARKPGATISQLNDTLGVTKQSFSRVIRELIGANLVALRVGDRDRRQRLVFLTEDGGRLEAELFAEMRQNMERAYTASGEQAVQGYWTMMQNLMSPDIRQRFASFHSAPIQARC